MKSNVVARLNKIAEIIREKKAVPFGEPCVQIGIAPSTMYGYIRVMKNLFLDIKFQDGLFTTIGKQKVEELSSQRKLLAE